MSSRTKKRILITTGNADGIGTEVAYKALSNLGPQAGIQFIVFRSTNTPPRHLELTEKKFSRHEFSTLSSALVENFSASSLLEVVNSNEPHIWVREAAEACYKKIAAGLVTGPMRKFKSRGQTYGHTEILAEVSGVTQPFMTFIGDRFSVISLTGHVPVSAIGRTNWKARINSAIASVLSHQELFSISPSRPLALVGLNPHAGEKGAIGKEELKIFKPLLAQFRKRRIPIVGPLVPDAAFLPSQWSKYSAYLCPYHDQALIPFKAIHGQETGFHLTLGIPFIRTSVDHGTAEDIFNKNQAHPGSMIEAVRWAVKACRQS